MKTRSALTIVLATSVVFAAGGCRDEAPSRSRRAMARANTARPLSGAVKVHRFKKRSIVLGNKRSARGSDLYGHPRTHLLARRLCEALHRLPATRKRACCTKQGGGDGFNAYSACLRTVSSALRARGVSLSSADVRRCEQAMNKATAGCGWVGPWGPVMPAACDNILHGRLARGARCRSSLECKGALRCHGVGPRERGRCGPALAAGHSCGTAVDPLAVYSRQRSSETSHPECKGYCYRHKCVPTHRLGSACKTSVECGPGQHCAAGSAKGERRCQSGLAALGKPCAGGGCGAGLRCYKSRCMAPLASGTQCNSDLECAGACVDGRCAQRCLPKILAKR